MISETIKSNLKNRNESSVPNIKKTDEIKKEHIETLPDSKDLKEKLDKDKEKNKKQVEEAIPKLIIKIPKPFAMGYFIIDIGAFLKGLLGGLLAMLSALLIGLLMAKLAELLGELLANIAAQKGNLSTTDITNSLNSINMNDVMTSLIDQENLMSLNKMLSDSGITTGSTTSEIIFNLQNQIDTSETYSNDNVTIQSDIQPIVPIINKKENPKDFYSINRRGRSDLLNSDEVKQRLSGNNTHRRSVYNPNYGKYW